MDEQKPLYNPTVNQWKDRLQILRETNKLPLKSHNLFLSSNNENDDKSVKEHMKECLQILGAKIDRSLSQKITIMVSVSTNQNYKHMEKAQSLNIPIVNILWIEACVNTLEFIETEKFLIKYEKIDKYDRPILANNFKGIPSQFLTRKNTNNVKSDTQRKSKKMVKFFHMTNVKNYINQQFHVIFLVQDEIQKKYEIKFNFYNLKLNKFNAINEVEDELNNSNYQLPFFGEDKFSYIYHDQQIKIPTDFSDNSTKFIYNKNKINACEAMIYQFPLQFNYESAFFFQKKLPLIQKEIFFKYQSLYLVPKIYFFGVDKDIQNIFHKYHICILEQDKKKQSYLCQVKQLIEKQGGIVIQFLSQFLDSQQYSCCKNMHCYVQTNQGVKKYANLRCRQRTGIVINQWIYDSILFNQIQNPKNDQYRVK